MKIALLPLYLELYDKLRPEWGENSRAFAAQIKDVLEKQGFEVVASPVCRLKDEFSRAVKSFEDAGCQAIATLHLAYSPSLESIDALSATKLPLVVVDTTPDFEFIFPAGIARNHGIHGVQDLCNLLIRRRKSFLLSVGHWQDPVFIEKTANKLKSAAMAWRISNARVGKVGGDFAGMGDFRIEDGALGFEIVPYSQQPEVSEEEVTAELLLDRERFAFDESVTEEAHRETIAASLKLRRWVENAKLDAFTITFTGIDRRDQWQTVPFLECSKAMARGIGYAGEGDVLTAAATRCLLDVWPESSFTEMFCPDWKNNRIFTSHMGEINIDLTAAKSNLHLLKYIYSDTGDPLIATGCFKAGKAVLTNLAPGPDKTFTLIAAKVEFKAPDEPSGKSNAGWFSPAEKSLDDFLDAYSQAGATHHLTLSYGADISILRDWAALMQWNFVEI